MKAQPSPSPSPQAPAVQNSKDGSCTVDAKTITSRRKSQDQGPSASATPIALSTESFAAPVLTTIVFGSGECGELGLGPKETVSLVGRVDPFLDPQGQGKIQVVQIACGGIHTIALTADNKIMTWGVNDEFALGRDTKWNTRSTTATATGI